MRLEDLFPYWESAHEQLLETIGSLSQQQLDARPHPEATSIREIVLHLIREERFWIGQLILGHAEYRPPAQEFPTATALVDALAVNRGITRRVLDPLSEEGLRAVRTVPADLTVNRPETNMPIRRLIWHVLELEVFCRGQIALRLQDEKFARGEPNWSY